MYKIDLLRQIEANTRGGELSDCYSKYDLWRMIERNTRSKPAPLKKWTPNYTGQGYVEIPEWHGVAGDVVEFTALRGVTSAILCLFDNGIYAYNNKFDWDGNPDLYTFFVNGIQTYNKDAWEANVELNIKIVLTTDKVISLLGAYRGALNSWRGTIKNIKLTKADGSDNRFYESVIESETQPATLVLKDSISGKDGKMINFPADEAWTDKYNLANGTWDMSNRELVSFTRSTKAWLDGKEYAPNEPRYTESGELLVEGQATNEFPRSANMSAINLFHGATAIFNATETEAEITPLEENYSGFYSTGININAGDVLTFELKTSIKNSGFNLCLHTVLYDATEDYKSYEYKLTRSGQFSIYPVGFNAESGGTFSIKNIQVNNPTSFIPTTTTAVTRAADIATVRDK